MLHYCPIIQTCCMFRLLTRQSVTLRYNARLSLESRNSFYTLIEQNNQKHRVSIFSWNLPKSRGFSFYSTILNSSLNITNNVITRFKSTTSSNKTLNITTEQKGGLHRLDFRLYFRNESGPISSFHDIPLQVNNGESNFFNMVVEIPRWTNAKMEIATKEPLNPIKQDVKNGALRYVSNCFPYHGYIWNYGALPQTWENPNYIEPATGCKGDNDPIDVLEIGKIQPTGGIVQVKVLGCICIIDEGETDWKILAIDVSDPIAQQLNDVTDIRRLMPGYLRATAEWFQIYKVPQGKSQNKLAFNGEAKNAEFALNIVGETHENWHGLMNNTLDNPTGLNLITTTKNFSSAIGFAAAEEIVKSNPDIESPGPVDPLVDKWHYGILQS